MERWRFILSGRVQGVGLRVRAYMAAGEMPITGTVTNLYDGTVKLEAQGEKKHIDKFLERISQLPYVRIDNIDAEQIPVIPEKSFSMRY